MDLIDRYVNEIRHQLPREKANDIAAEIEDDLRSQVEEREGELGRPLDSCEMSELVCRYGNPYVVAYRYRPQQYLVGPALMPFFWRTYGTFVVAFICAALWLSFSAANFGHPFDGTLDVAFQGAFWGFAIVAGAFALIERFGNPGKVAAWLSRWSPRILPKNADERYYVARFTSGAETIANALMFYVAFTLLRQWQAVPLVHAEPVRFAIAGFLLSTVIVAAGANYAYIRPWAGRVRLAAHVLGYAAVIVGCTLALRDGIFAIAPWLGYGAAGAIVVGLIAGGIDLWNLIGVRQTAGSETSAVDTP